MAEAAAAPLAVAAAQWSLAAARKFRSAHPKRRLDNWKGKVKEALKEIDEQRQKIPPSDMVIVLEAHAIWEDIAGRFETELKEKKLGLFSLKAWTSGKEVWERAKTFERLAMSTSATAIRDSLRCEQYHHVQLEGCYHCIEQRRALVPTSPDPRPQQETITYLPVIHETSHPTIYINIQVGSYSTDDQPNGQTLVNFCVSSLATMDHVPSQTPPVAPPETVDTP